MTTNSKEHHPLHFIFLISWFLKNLTPLEHKLHVSTGLYCLTSLSLRTVFDSWREKKFFYFIFLGIHLLKIEKGCARADQKNWISRYKSVLAFTVFLYCFFLFNDFFSYLYFLSSISFDFIFSLPSKVECRNFLRGGH